jgi:hypothetical protein
MSKRMNTVRLGKIVVNVFRIGISLGVGFILWLQSQTVSKEAFNEYKTNQDREERLIVTNINDKFDSIQTDLRRIYAKLDRLVAAGRLEPELEEVIRDDVKSKVRGKL